MNPTTSKTTVGIITIATGKYYDEFIPTLKDSIDQYFDASQLSVQFYCFTDASKVRPDITGFPIAHLAWPFSTLLRFYWIKQHLDQLLKHDFLLYMDADMKVVQAIPSEIFAYDLIAVQHPGYLDASPAFEIDRQDSIYVAPNYVKLTIRAVLGWSLRAIWPVDTKSFCAGRSRFKAGSYSHLAR